MYFIMLFCCQGHHSRRSLGASQQGPSFSSKGLRKNPARFSRVSASLSRTSRVPALSCQSCVRTWRTLKLISQHVVAAFVLIQKYKQKGIKEFEKSQKAAAEAGAQEEEEDEVEDDAEEEEDMDEVRDVKILRSHSVRTWLSELACCQ